jgi:hypothetical protein
MGPSQPRAILPDPSAQLSTAKWATCPWSVDMDFADFTNLMDTARAGASLLANFAAGLSDGLGTLGSFIGWLLGLLA